MTKIDLRIFFKSFYLRNYFFPNQLKVCNLIRKYMCMSELHMSKKLNQSFTIIYDLVETRLIALLSNTIEDGFQVVEFNKCINLLIPLSFTHIRAS